MTLFRNILRVRKRGYSGNIFSRKKFVDDGKHLGPATLVVSLLIACCSGRFFVLAMVSETSAAFASRGVFDKYE